MSEDKSPIKSTINDTNLEDIVKNTESTGYIPHKLGRPTLQAEEEMQKTLQYYYTNNIGVESTAAMSGIAIATVSKYFRIWRDEAYILLKKDFAEKQKEERDRALQAIDFQLVRMLKLQAEIEDEVERWNNAHPVDINTGEKPIAPSIITKQRLRAEIATSIAQLQDMKASVAMTPTIDDDIEGRIILLLKRKELVNAGFTIEQPNEEGHASPDATDRQSMEQDESGT